jgi:hypothetical protein
MIWWPRLKYKTNQAKLSKLQRLACLGGTGAMRTAPTAAIEVLLGLPPLHLKMEAETRVRIYRLSCNELWRPKSLRCGHTSIARDMIKEPVLHMGTDKMIPTYAFHEPFTVKLPSRSEWDRGFVPIQQGGLIWYTDGSKTSEGTGAGVYVHCMRWKLTFSLGRYTTVFQVKYMLLKHVLMRILKGATVIGTFIFFLIWPIIL